MRRPLVAVIALLATCWSLGSQASDCPCQPRAVRHHVVMHRVIHRRVTMADYAGCPIALAQVIRPGCNSYYRTYYLEVP
jgi:hypothetical protein